MAISLYEAVVPSQLQILRAVDRLLGKAVGFAGDEGMSEEDLIGAKLAPDMLPLGYQVKSCVAHSVGGIAGVRQGSFSPDRSGWPHDLAGLRALIVDAIARLEAITPEEIDALADNPTTFQFGEMTMPFTGANFLLSFSQPNFYFHAAVAYAILRHLGMKVGKSDFLGRPRVTM